MNETETRLGTATYDPGDNKLRLSCFARLSKEDYAHARATGFIWAPKQEIFVAPMWTPEREDLLLEWCGEIGDEDSTLVERSEQRADRFDGYSDQRKADADSAHKAVESICEHIPLGQPILVGHHSEKHARRDAERIENGMRRAVKMWEQSEYWKDRAKGLIRAAKYKERPDVRARRIKGIEADKRKRERTKAEAEHLIRFWQGKLCAKNPQTGEKRPIEITQENRAFLCKMLGRMPACGVHVRGNDGQNYYGAWDILRPDEERYSNCPVKTVAELQEIALRLQAEVIARCDRWIAHYDNRLAYERAMLEADGGTATDKKGPEKNGACRCWASPSGGWSYIQKVNKVSVTVLDNWGNGGGNFTRTIPFDKLKAVMTAAEVQTARDCGALVEVSDKTGFVLRGSGMDAAAVKALPESDKDKAKFEALKETVKAGVQIVTADDLFPTPTALADRVCELAELTAGDKVLEPSAGTGQLVKAAISRGIFRADITAAEVNPRLCELLSQYAGKVLQGDFLERNGDLGKFDRIVMNPPFANGQDIVHIKHAMTFLNPGGRLVAICANGPRQKEQLRQFATEWHDLEPGAFKESGTMVNAALIVIDA